MIVRSLCLFGEDVVLIAPTDFTHTHTHTHTHISCAIASLLEECLFHICLAVYTLPFSSLPNFCQHLRFLTGRAADHSPSSSAAVMEE